MKANEMPHEMSLQEKAICLAVAGRKPELPYPLKEVECADGTVQRIYEIPDEDMAKVLADLYPFAGGPGIDDVSSTSTSGRPSRCATSSSSDGARETSSPAPTSRALAE